MDDLSLDMETMEETHCRLEVGDLRFKKQFGIKSKVLHFLYVSDLLEKTFIHDLKCSIDTLPLVSFKMTFRMDILFICIK